MLKIPIEFINSADRNRLGALGRGVVGLIGRKLGGHTIRAVAEHFNRDPVAITQGVKKVEAKLREESDSKQAIEKIEKTLSTKREKKYLIAYAWYPIYDHSEVDDDDCNHWNAGRKRRGPSAPEKPRRGKGS